MSRSFNRQRRNFARLVEPNALVDNVFVAALESVVLELEIVLQKFMQAVRRNGVGDNRRAGVVGRKNRRHHRNQGVAAYLFAVAQNRAHPVNVRVENQSEVGF